MRKFLVLLFTTVVIVAVGSGTALSQNREGKDDKKSGRKFFSPSDIINLTKADNNKRVENYRAAILYYLKVYEHHRSNARLNYRLGMCYVEINDKKQAIRYLEKAIELKPKITPWAHFYLGRAYHMNAELDKALSEYNRFKQVALSTIIVRSEVDKFISQSNYANEVMKNPSNVKIENLGPGINSGFPDYAPSITGDENSLVFTSRRENTTGGGKDPNDFEFYEDVYMTKWEKEKNGWTVPQSVSPLINADGHDASLSISPDGNTIYLYKNNSRGIRGGDIYFSTLTADKSWSAPKPLPVSVNTPYFESSASITGDGKILYFVSERLGGYGRGDIYRCVKGASGDWGPAENLGPLINSEEDEICSYISNDGKILYFSSRGHLSMGGYDIFKSTYENGRWTAPVNMGYPINTTEDDLHFVISTDGRNAFYSAIREGGFGDRDIYSIDLSQLNMPKVAPRKMVVIKGSVEDDDGKTTDAEVQVVDAESGKPVGMFRTTASGKYIASVLAGNKYTIVVQKNGFESFQEEINIANTNDTVSVINIDKIIRLKRLYEKKKEETEVFKYILFELASSDLKLDEASKIKLDNVIKSIKNNPKMHIKLGGHTDIIGEESYNRQLSVKRAQVVAAYMKSKGLAASRISIESFGADKPVQSNDTEEGRKLNRRVELEVIEK